MKVIGKFITSQSDFDAQPVWLIEVQNLSFVLQRRIFEALENKQSCIEIDTQDWEELHRNNMFDLTSFPCVIEGYLDFEVEVLN